MSESKKGTVERRLEEARRFLHTALDRPELLDAFPEEVYVPLGVDVASLFAEGRLELLRQISRSAGTVGELARIRTPEGAFSLSRPPGAREARAHSISNGGQAEVP